MRYIPIPMLVKPLYWDLLSFQQYVLSLERKDLVLKLADWAGLVVAEGLSCLLEAADHRGRTADEDLDVVGGLGEPFLENIVSHTFETKSETVDNIQ